jgi:hypothetical protein
VCTNRAEGRRNAFELYPCNLRQRLPRVRIPLADGDRDVRLDLQAALERVYEAGAYAARIDYGVPCRPPLEPDDEPWAKPIVAGE